MDKNEKVKRLKNHIKALNKGYENIIEILNEDVEKKAKKDGEDEKIALKDDKIKTYADGLLKSAETADAFLSKIQVKETELEELLKNISDVDDEKENSDNSTENKKTVVSEGETELSKRLH